MDEKVIGENKKINKKIVIIIAIVIIAIIAILILIFSDKGESNEKFTYLESTKEISRQGEYLSSTISSVMEKINSHKISGNVKFSDVGISAHGYGDCDGKISIENNVYKLTAECEKDNDDAYKIEQSLIKGTKLEQMQNIIRVENGYVFMGSGGLNKGVVGYLDDSDTIKWETEIPFDSENSSVLSVNMVIDGYIATIQKPIDEENSELQFIKLDKNGNIVKTNKIKTEAYVLIPKSNFNDIVVAACDDYIYILNKDGDVTKEVRKAGITAIAVSENNVYCIDSNETIYSFDKNGNIIDQLSILDPEELVMNFEVANGKYFVLYNKKLLTFDSEGKELNNFDYYSLAVSKKTKHEQGMIVDSYKIGNNIYVCYLVDEYIITDKYNQNLELIERITYKSHNLEINSVNYNLKMFLNEEIVNINYSDQYKMFIKNIYGE